MIQFYFDFISPYSYLAWTQIHELAGRRQRLVEPVPVLLAGLLGHHGTRGPAEVPAKRVYVFVDCVRTARRLGVPLSPPPTHPFNPLLALRAASLELDDDLRRQLIDALFAEVWGGGRGVEDEGVVTEIGDRLGIDDIAARAREPAIKERLRSQTEELVGLGGFGVPTMAVNGEIFWGLDSFANLEAHLQGQRLPEDLLERWAHVQPSATR